MVFLDLGFDRTIFISPNPAMNCVNVTIYDDEIIEAIQPLTLALQEENLHILFQGNSTLLVKDNDRRFAVVLLLLLLFVGTATCNVVVIVVIVVIRGHSYM